MLPEVKFCGLTRVEDAVLAANLGVAYAGVVLAGGRRHRTVEQAASLLAPLRGRLRRVAVVAGQDLAELERLAAVVAPDVLQLHTPRPLSSLGAIRNATGAEIWVAVNARDGSLPPSYDESLSSADGVVLDSLGADGRGGSGTTVDWERLALELERRGRPARLVLAGGLRPANLAGAIGIIAPDVVDVSSGVESAPGVKDEGLMQAFRDVALACGRTVTS